MAAIVYMLCSFMSAACAWLLYRGYQKNQFRLLLWSCLGFLGFAVNNILLFVDLITMPELDLKVIRTLPALIGLLVMINGLVSDTTAE